MKKKILITGAFGFIGSHLAELFVRKGFEVIAFDRYNSNNNWGWLEHSKFKNEIEVVLGDIRDYDSVSKAIEKCKVVEGFENQYLNENNKYNNHVTDKYQSYLKNEVERDMKLMGVTKINQLNRTNLRFK